MAVADALAVNNNLLELDLRGGVLSAAAVACLAEAVKAGGTLRRLELSVAWGSTLVIGDAVVLSADYEDPDDDAHEGPLKREMGHVGKVVAVDTERQHPFTVEFRGVTWRYRPEALRPAMPAADDPALAAALASLNAALFDNNLRALSADRVGSYANLSRLGLTKASVGKLAAALRKTASTFWLDLSGNDALGDGGVRAVAAAVEGTAVCEVKLEGCGASEAAADKARAAAKANDIQPLLRSISTSATKPFLAIRMRDTPQLLDPFASIGRSKRKRADLSFRGFTEDQAGHLADALASNTNLLELDLRGSVLGVAAVARLAEAVKAGGTLRRLYFPEGEFNAELDIFPNIKSPFDFGRLRQRNSPSKLIYDRSKPTYKAKIPALASVLASLHATLFDNNLRALSTDRVGPFADLSRLGLTEESVGKLAAALKKAVSTTELDLSGNDALGDGGVLAVALIVEGTALCEVKLEGCGASKVAVDELKAAVLSNEIKLIVTMEPESKSFFGRGLSRAQADLLVDVLARNTSLLELDLRGSVLGATAVARLAEAVAKGGALRRLELSNAWGCTLAMGDAVVLSADYEGHEDAAKGPLEGGDVGKVIAVDKSYRFNVEFHDNTFWYCADALQPAVPAADDPAPAAALASLNAALFDNNLRALSADRVGQSADLSRMGLTEASVGKLAAALKKAVSTTELDLSNNDMLGDGGVRAMAAALEGTAVCEVELEGCGASEAAEDELLAVLLSNDIKMIGKMGPASKSFVGRGLSEAQAGILADVLASNTTLLELDLRGSVLGATAVTRLAEAVKMGATLRRLELSRAWEGTLAIGDDVVLSADYEGHGDAADGPLKPMSGYVGKVIAVDNSSRPFNIKFRNKTFWYCAEALQPAVPAADDPALAVALASLNAALFDNNLRALSTDRVGQSANLSRLGLTEASMGKLAAALQKAVSTTELDLSGNDALGDGGVLAVAAALEGTAVIDIGLRGCGASKAAMAKAKKAAQANGRELGRPPIPLDSGGPDTPPEDDEQEPEDGGPNGLDTPRASTPSESSSDDPEDEGSDGPETPRASTPP